MNHGEVADDALEAERPEPFLVLLANLAARPVHGRGGEFGKAVERTGHGSLFVVVSFDHRTVERTDEVDAGHRVGAVADQVAEANVMGAPLGLRVGQDRLQGFEIAVDVTEDGDAHGTRVRGQTPMAKAPWQSRSGGLMALPGEQGVRPRGCRVVLRVR